MLTLQKFSFIFALIIVTREILTITKPLSSQLQASHAEIARVHHDIDQAKGQVRQFSLPSLQKGLCCKRHT